MDGGLKLADVFGRCFQLEIGHTVDVNVVVGSLRRRIIEVHHWHRIGLKTLLQALVGELEPELGGAHLSTKTLHFAK